MPARILALVLFGAAVACAQPAYVIQDAKVYTVSGQILNKASVVIEDGRIREVGTKAFVPSGAIRIDGRGLSVYPGLFDASSYVGLSGTPREIEFGPLMPEFLFASSFRPEAARIPHIRANGITHLLSRQRGALIPGQAPVMNLADWSAWDSEVKRQAALVIEFPSVGPLEFSDDERFAIVPFSSIKTGYDRRVRDLKQLFAKARAYKPDASALADVKLDALQPVLRGELPVIIEANNRADIRAAVQFGKEEKLNFFIGGATEAAHVADFLKDNNVRVILGPSQSVPEAEDDPIDIIYRTAGILHRKGVPFAMSTTAAPGFDSWDLPYQVGFAIANGLPYDAGLRSVTLTPAEFFGVADKLGSIEKGKMANLVVAEGDIFDYTTRIKHVFIKGRPVSLQTRHTEDYEKYKKR